MARTRGEANRALYRAHILLKAWDDLREGSSYDNVALTGAFVPAVRLHLRLAYGWFLLSVTAIEESSVDRPPRSTADLPEPPAGRAQPPEVAEFVQLENAGWLAQLISEDMSCDGDNGNASSAAFGRELLSSDRAPVGYAVVRSWADELAEIMRRMDDSCVEY